MKARGHTCFHSGRKTSIALVSASESAVTGTGLAGSNGSFGADCIRMGDPYMGKMSINKYGVFFFVFESGQAERIS